MDKFTTSLQISISFACLQSKNMKEECWNIGMQILHAGFIKITKSLYQLDKKDKKNNVPILENNQTIRNLINLFWSFITVKDIEK